jgi:alanine racemase
MPSLATPEMAAALARATKRYLPVQLEVDTGMARHGIPAGELRSFMDQLQHRGRLAVAAVFTHFSGLSAADVPVLRDQLAKFAAAVDGVRALRGVPQHACNTLGALVLRDAHLDAVRIGGGLYGFDPLAGHGAVQLRPAMTLKARIACVRQAEIGDRVGYGGTFVCARPTRLALLPIGYADGLSNSWRGGEVLVRGRRARIVGRISMNQTTVDVTELPVLLGEEAVLLGAQGDQRVLAEDRVPAGGSCYEVTAALRASLPRHYLPRRIDAGWRIALANAVAETGSAAGAALDARAPEHGQHGPRR